MAKATELIRYLRMAGGTGFAFVLFGVGGLVLNGIILLVGWVPVPSLEKKEWAMQKVTSIEECEARCDGYTYMALACPSDMSQGWRRADDHRLRRVDARPLASVRSASSLRNCTERCA